MFQAISLVVVVSMNKHNLQTILFLNILNQVSRNASDFRNTWESIKTVQNKK